MKIQDMAGDWGGGGGLPHEGGEFSGLNAMPNTEGQPILTISYTCKGFPNYNRTG